MGAVLADEALMGAVLAKRASSPAKLVPRAAVDLPGEVFVCDSRLASATLAIWIGSIITLVVGPRGRFLSHRHAGRPVCCPSRGYREARARSPAQRAAQYVRHVSRRDLRDRLSALTGFAVPPS